MLPDFMVPCTMLDRVSRPNGLGGVDYAYTPGAGFRAALTLNNSEQMQVAYSNGQTSVFTVAVLQPMQVKSGDRFRRDEDGVVFEAISNTRDMTAPPMASANMRFSQFNAKVVEKL